jgi:hypothetical protein
VQITGIDHLPFKAQLQEIAKKMHDSKVDEIRKSDRRRLVTLAGMVYESQHDAQPVYAILASILAITQEAAKVPFPAPFRISSSAATPAGSRRKRRCW